MRMIGLSGTTVTAFQTINELLGKRSLSKEFVASVALTILDTHHGCALAPDPGGQNAPHNALFSGGTQCDLHAYALVVLAILQFCKVAKLKPNPPKSSTVRVELTISAPAPAGADPGKSEGTCITTTFVFADELARTVTDFLAGYNSPSRSDLLEFLQQTGGPIAGLFITHQDNNHVRSLTLLGEDAEDGVVLPHALFQLPACGRYG